ncbi:F-box family protein, partial [Prunus dulcis]
MEDSHDQYSSSVTHSLFGSQEYNKDYTFPILPNLKHLELTVEGDYKLSLSQLSSFMKASPYLQRLALKLRFWENPFNEGRKIKKLSNGPTITSSGSESGKRERKKEAKARRHANMHLKNR